MHDLRAAPRWSKTAVVVVLVVFGLILVVAIFALWAFRSAADNSRTRARVDAAQKTAKEMAEVETEVLNHLLAALARTKRVANQKQPVEEPGAAAQPVPANPADALAAVRELRGFLSGQGHGRFVRDAFLVSVHGEFQWLEGEFRLADQPARIEAEAAAQAAAAAKGKSLETDLEDAGFALKRGPKEAVPHWESIAKRFGLLTQEDGGISGAKARGVTYAKYMLRHAADALEQDPGALGAGRVRRLVLRALEIESLNTQRQGLDEAYLEERVEDVSAEIEGLLGRLPAADAQILRWEVDRFRRTRAQVLDMLQKAVLTPAINTARREGKSERYIVWEQFADFSQSHLFGIDYISPREPILIVLMRTNRVEELIERKLDDHASTFLSLGMRAHLLRENEAPVLPAGRDPADELALKGSAHELPFLIVVDRVSDPADVDEGFTGVMFWFVIVLSVAGLGVGGRVLVRLLTREVRLAQLKADFVSNLSHELKTPITSISLFTEMLEDGKITDPEDTAEAYSVLAAESTRLQGLVARMIDVARGEARSVPYELIPGDLNRPVLEATTRFRRIITEPGMDLDIQLHPEPLAMLMDLSSMDDVVTNLLSNAWKYKRGDKAVISVRTQRRGRQAILTVTDDGMGIPKSDRRKVFEMFYRADQYLTHPVPGTGLGLALVRSVVAGHKGRVRIDAGPGGVGTTFRLRFPLVPRLALHLAREKAQEERDSGSDSEQTAGPHGKVESAEGEVTQEAGAKQGGMRTPEEMQESQIRSGASNPGAQS